MYLHEKMKVIFIAHPRTASSATSHLLLSLGFKVVADHHRIIRKAIQRDDLVFATVRHPLDVFVSWYCNKKREQASFSEWLPVFLEQATIMQDGLFPGTPHCTHILKYESLQKYFTRFMIHAGFQEDQLEIPYRNVSMRRKGRPFMSYYTPKTIQMVTERFQDEFKQHGYNIPRIS